jgi:hypothetical protein
LLAGIGYFVWNEWNNLSLTNVIFAIVMIGVGMLLDLGFAAARPCLCGVTLRKQPHPVTIPRTASMKNTACGDFSDRRFEQTYVPGKPFGLCNLPASTKASSSPHHRPLGLRQNHGAQRAGRTPPRRRPCFMDNHDEIVGPSLERGVVFQSHALRCLADGAQNIALPVLSRNYANRSTNTLKVRRYGGPGPSD